MDKETIKKALEELKKTQKRNFTQTVDLVFVLRHIDVKKKDEQIEYYHQLHHSPGKEIKVCALVGPELEKQAKKVFDKTVLAKDFSKYKKNKKLVNNLAKEHDFFVGQATLMPKIASAFGKVLGPRGKMPDPKAGCVVPPNANLKPLSKKLKRTVRIAAKKSPMIQLSVGKEDSEEENIINNVMTIYDSLIHELPGGRNNIKKALIKYTMSKPIKLE